MVALRPFVGLLWTLQCASFGSWVYRTDHSEIISVKIRVGVALGPFHALIINVDVNIARQHVWFLSIMWNGPKLTAACVAQCWVELISVGAWWGCPKNVERRTSQEPHYQSWQTQVKEDIWWSQLLAQVRNLDVLSFEAEINFPPLNSCFLMELYIKRERFSGGIF